MITKVKLDRVKLKVNYTDPHATCHTCYFNTAKRECPVRKKELLCLILSKSDTKQAYFVKEGKK